MASFIGELKRRNVFKIGVAYAIVAVDCVNCYGRQQAAASAGIVLLAIRFPMACELTPECINPTQSVVPAESR